MTTAYQMVELQRRIEGIADWIVADLLLPSNCHI